MKFKSLSVLLSFGFIVGISPIALALPIIAVDTDPGTVGIQSTRSVLPGTTFTVDVVISDDGNAPTPTIFDTVVLDVFFTTAAGALAFGPTGPVAGSLTTAGGSGVSSDAFDLSPPIVFGPVGPGSPLTTDGAPAAAGTQGLGGVGYSDPLTYVVGASPFTILSVDFVALPSFGSSTIDTSGIFDGPALALAGSPLGPGATDPTVHIPGTINVIPEPSTLLLLGSGILGLIGARRRYPRRRGSRACAGSRCARV